MPAMSRRARGRSPRESRRDSRGQPRREGRARRSRRRAAGGLDARPKRKRGHGVASVRRRAEIAHVVVDPRISIRPPRAVAIAKWRRRDQSDQHHSQALPVRRGRTASRTSPSIPPTRIRSRSRRSRPTDGRRERADFHLERQRNTGAERSSRAERQMTGTGDITERFAGGGPYAGILRVRVLRLTSSHDELRVAERDVRARRSQQRRSAVSRRSPSRAGRTPARIASTSASTTSRRPAARPRRSSGVWMRRSRRRRSRASGSRSAAPARPARTARRFDPPCTRTARCTRSSTAGGRFPARASSPPTSSSCRTTAGRAAAPFTALGDRSDNVAGRLVVTGVQFMERHVSETASAAIVDCGRSEQLECLHRALRRAVGQLHDPRPALDGPWRDPVGGSQDVSNAKNPRWRSRPTARWPAYQRATGGGATALGHTSSFRPTRSDVERHGARHGAGQHPRADLPALHRRLHA